MDSIKFDGYDRVEHVSDENLHGMIGQLFSSNKSLNRPKAPLNAFADQILAMSDEEFEATDYDYYDFGLFGTGKTGARIFREQYKQQTT